MSERFVEVTLPLALRRALAYGVPETLNVSTLPGSRVLVPLGKKTAVGCVSGEARPKQGLKIKDVLEVLDEKPLLSESELKLLQWASAYYLTPAGEVLRHMAPPSVFENPRKKRAKKEALLPASRPLEPGPDLSNEQRRALDAVLRGLGRPERPILLHGVTGSGKTEIYREAAREAVAGGGQCLILVPEIGLTPQIVSRFETLGVPTAAYHSALTPAERRKVWEGARDGSLKIVVATRSGVFLRFPSLRLLVVDEEHDGSYKQEERFCYHARDLALWRGAEEGFLVVLGSATPSLESLHRVDKGRMERLRLEDRPSGALLPRIELVDLRRRSEQDDHPIFSRRLIDAVEGALKRKEQALLFLNRRGLSPFVLCPACGAVPECGQCDISLTLHRGRRANDPAVLMCHYCDATVPYEPVCSACRQGTLQPRGFGTEKVASEAARLFPNARIARLDRDAMGGPGGGAWRDILEKMRRREIDLLVGTQIITKGHDYPYLTLVGILDADLSLHVPDFRASERTFQIITQVSGRAGRAERAGLVIIQTYRPEHESLSAAVRHDGPLFYRAELATRQEARYPPYARLVEIRLSGPQSATVQAHSLGLAKTLRARLSSSDVDLLGPSPCPIERVRGRTRWHLLLKTSHYTKTQPELRRVLDDFVENHLPSNIRILANVDPVDMT